MYLLEKMFIMMSSFVFGYCIGYYSYNFLKPKHAKDEIIYSILRYNIKHGVVDKKMNKLKSVTIVTLVKI